jgi:hypothetical protein
VPDFQESAAIAFLVLIALLTPAAALLLRLGCAQIQMVLKTLLPPLLVESGRQAPMQLNAGWLHGYVWKAWDC